MQLFGHEIGNDRRLFLIAGPCVLESEQLALDIASTLATLARRLGILVIFKASFDKANRTSRASFRGPGLLGYERGVALVIGGEWLVSRLKSCALELVNQR